MAKFWEQDWFRDALPYVAGGLAAAGALAGVGYSRGWFGGNAATDLTSLVSGPEQELGSAAPNVLPGGEIMKGGEGFLGRASGFIQRNPSVLALGGLGALAALNSSQDTPGPEDQARNLSAQTDALRRADQNRWNSIPFRPMSQVPTYARPGGVAPGGERALGGERRYFNSGGAIGEAAGQRMSNGALVGPGDGLSDDIPAVAVGNNGETRPVMVADGEYVIAADVVSGIGNGSTNAGIRWLDNLQETVRSARTGGQQPGPIQRAIGGAV